MADKLPEEQHTLGFSMQTLLIGIGAVVGSWLPYILGNWLGISKEASAAGLIPPNVTFSFYFGAFVLIAAIIWTVSTTKEYPPEFYDDENLYGIPDTVIVIVTRRGFRISGYNVLILIIPSLAIIYAISRRIKRNLKDLKTA